jgi:hypothetical protein
VVVVMGAKEDQEYMTARGQKGASYMATGSYHVNLAVEVALLVSACPVLVVV